MAWSISGNSGNCWTRRSRHHADEPEHPGVFEQDILRSRAMSTTARMLTTTSEHERDHGMVRPGDMGFDVLH